jgi:Oxidoreductase family, NAD-binding Rossmann fold
MTNITITNGSSTSNNNAVVTNAVVDVTSIVTTIEDESFTTVDMTKVTMDSNTNNANKDRGDSVDLTLSTTAGTTTILSDDNDNVSIGSLSGSSIVSSDELKEDHPADTSTVVVTGVDTMRSSTSTVTQSNNNTNNNTVTRVAILGCGMMGQEHCSYIMGYSQRNNLRIDYLCDTHIPSINKCLSVMKEFTATDGMMIMKQPTIVLTEDELYDNYLSQIDLLVVATPNYLHTNILLRWGVHQHLTILVEKPVCVSYDQHTQLTNVLSLSSSNDNIPNTIHANVWVAMEYRFIPAISKLIQLLPTIGDIKMITIRENRYPFLHKVNSWNRYSTKTGDTLVEKW